MNFIVKEAISPHPRLSIRPLSRWSFASSAAPSKGSCRESTATHCSGSCPCYDINVFKRSSPREPAMSKELSILVLPVWDPNAVRKSRRNCRRRLLRICVLLWHVPLSTGIVAERKDYRNIHNPNHITSFWEFQPWRLIVAKPLLPGSVSLTNRSP